MSPIPENPSVIGKQGQLVIQNLANNTYATIFKKMSTLVIPECNGASMGLEQGPQRCFHH